MSKVSYCVGCARRHVAGLKPSRAQRLVLCMPSKHLPVEAPDDRPFTDLPEHRNKWEEVEPVKSRRETTEPKDDASATPDRQSPK